MRIRDLFFFRSQPAYVPPPKPEPIALSDETRAYMRGITLLSGRDVASYSSLMQVPFPAEARTSRNYSSDRAVLSWPEGSLLFRLEAYTHRFQGMAESGQMDGELAEKGNRRIFGNITVIKPATNKLPQVEQRYSLGLDSTGNLRAIFDSWSGDVEVRKQAAEHVTTALQALQPALADFVQAVELAKVQWEAKRAAATDSFMSDLEQIAAVKKVDPQAAPADIDTEL